MLNRSALIMNNDQLLRFKYKFTAANAALMVFVAIALTASLGYMAYANPDIRLMRSLFRLASPEEEYMRGIYGVRLDIYVKFPPWPDFPAIS